MVARAASVIPDEVLPPLRELAAQLTAMPSATLRRQREAWERERLARAVLVQVADAVLARRGLAP